jgi:hypothetical protein
MPTPKFKPGQSGNPAGRPANKAATILLRKAINEAMPEIIEALIDQAKRGDIAAATVLLNRCIPALKAEAQAINLPVKQTILEQGNEIITGIMSGKLAPDIGAGLINALAAQAKIVEADDVIRRIEALEAEK